MKPIRKEKTAWRRVLTPEEIAEKDRRDYEKKLRYDEYYRKKARRQKEENPERYEEYKKSLRDRTENQHWHDGVPPWNYTEAVKVWYERRCRPLGDAARTGIPFPSDKPYGLVYPAQWYHRTVSICPDCTVLDCSWCDCLKPVDGWNAVPSKIYSDGYQVLGCPLYRDGT